MFSRVYISGGNGARHVVARSGKRGVLYMYICTYVCLYEVDMSHHHFPVHLSSLLHFYDDSREDPSHGLSLPYVRLDPNEGRQILVDLVLVLVLEDGGLDDADAVLPLHEFLPLDGAQ